MTSLSVASSALAQPFPLWLRHDDRAMTVLRVHAVCGVGYPDGEHKNASHVMLYDRVLPTNVTNIER